MTLHRVLNGVPYCFTPNKWGWGICANQSPIDRVYRSYQVYCGEDGKPLRCSCAAFKFGDGKPCKHTKEVEKILSEKSEKIANSY